MNGIIPIILGVFVLLANDMLINYYERINLKFGIYVERKILFVRIIVGSIVLIIYGLIIFLTK